MKKLFFAGILVLAISGLAVAQDFPKVEVFGGYSYMRSDLNFEGPYMEDYYNYEYNGGVGNLNGFEASFTYNVNSWLGIKGDFGGHFGKQDVDRTYLYEYTDYEDYYEGGEEYYYTDKDEYEQKGTVDVRRYTYMFGPEFSYRGNERVRPFAHALFGFAKTDIHKIDIDWSMQETYQYYYDEAPRYYYREGNTTGSFSGTSFAMALGGGLDVNVNDKFAIRLFQIDYIPAYQEFKGDVNYWQKYYNDSLGPQEEWDDYYEWTRSWKIPSQKYNNLRLSTGIVLKF